MTIAQRSTAARSDRRRRRRPARQPRPARLRAEPFRLLTRRGDRRNPAWAWPVKTAAGETWRLTGLQRAGLLWITSQVGHHRHEWRIRDMAIGIDCSPGTASKVYRRLRSLSLIAGPHPARGRTGHATTWLPGKRAQERDARDRLARWPTRGKDSTLTTFGGFLSREGLSRSWSTMIGSPPSARPPGGWAALPASPRARRRPWPPAYVDEVCPQTGRRARLRLAASGRSGPDVGAVWAGVCPRCRRAHVVSMTFVRPDPESVRRPGDPHPTPSQRRQAPELVGLVDEPIGDVLRERYLGVIRTPVYVPPAPPLVDGPAERLAEFVDAARFDLLEALDVVASTRQLVPPSGGHNQ